MKEHVGECKRCGKAIYCENGFLNGIVRDNGILVCFDCDEKFQDEAPPIEKQ